MVEGAPIDLLIGAIHNYGNSVEEIEERGRIEFEIRTHLL
jgi:hypothetical protein